MIIGDRDAAKSKTLSRASRHNKIFSMPAAVILIITVITLVRFEIMDSANIPIQPLEPGGAAIETKNLEDIVPAGLGYRYMPRRPVPGNNKR